MSICIVLILCTSYYSTINMLNKILFLSFIFLLFTCSSRKDQFNNDNKSKNNFLAYYNTFFTAEKSFNEAEKLIQMQTDKDNLSTQINNLLDLAIQNCLIIESDFYQTKYLDDSYFILGMASYYKNKITASNYYFDQLILRFPESIYINRINIYKGFINLKIGRLDQYQFYINKLDFENLNNDEKFNYYLLKAYFYKVINNIDLVIDNYLESLKYSRTKINKYFIYNKLFEIAEQKNDYKSCVFYIEEIQKNEISTQFNKELFLKWLKYKNKLEEYADIILRLEELLQDAKILKDKIFYEVEIARAKIFSGKYDEAILILDELLERNSTSTVIKNEMSEMYYLLGQIYFLNDDYNLAQQNYQLSIDKSRASEYGKKSQEQISALIKYSNYKEEINYISSLPNTDNEFGQFNNNLDSLIFNLAQIQYFDLNLRKESIENFRKIIADFTESTFRKKSLIIMNINEPDTVWQEILDEDYSYNINNESDNIVVLIDNAWNLLENSNTDKCLEEFKRIYDVYDNDKSLYIISFIYDEYNNDVVNAMKYYKIYLEKFIDGEFYKTVNNRVLNIKSMYEEQISVLEQKVDFSMGFKWLLDDNNVDSSNFYFDLSSKGDDRTISLYSKSLKEKVTKFDKNMDLYLENKETVNMDSIRFNIANLLFFDFDAEEISKKYYLEIINNDNDYTNISYATLSIIDTLSSWDSRLYEIIKDSVEFNKLYDGLEKSQHVKYLRSIKIDDISKELIWLEDKYNFLFKESSTEVDSENSKIDMNHQVELDSFNVKLEDSLMIKNNLMKSLRSKSNIKNDSSLNKQNNSVIDSSKIRLNSIVE